MRRACGVVTILVLAGCGELAESRIERPVHESAEDAARAQVKRLFARGEEGHAELAALLRHPDVTEFHVSEVFRGLYSQDPPARRPKGVDLLVEPLVELAEDRSRDPELRRSALSALSQLGDRGRVFAPRIWPLLEDDELFTNAWGALMVVRWEPLIDVLIRTLDADHRGYRWGAIRDLGAFGPSAARAVPALSGKLLGEEPFEERLDVIETLKRIATPEAKASLVAAIESPRWRDVQYATLAVIELDVVEAQPVLRRVSERHWRTGIRNLTRVAAEVFDRRRRGEPPQSSHIRFRNGCYDDWSKPAVVELRGRRLEIPQIHDAPRPGRPAGFPAEVGFGDDDRCIQDYALLEGGWAVALDCGEWGGSVVFVAEDGTKSPLSPMNTFQFVRMGDRLFAVGGCDHMGLDRGNIVEIFRSAEGRWRAREMAQPIGTPHARLLTEEGLILAGQHGATLLRPDGTQEEVDCVVPR